MIGQVFAFTAPATACPRRSHGATRRSRTPERASPYRSMISTWSSRRSARAQGCDVHAFDRLDGRHRLLIQRRRGRPPTHIIRNSSRLTTARIPSQTFVVVKRPSVTSSRSPCSGSQPRVRRQRPQRSPPVWPRLWVVRLPASRHRPADFPAFGLVSAERTLQRKPVGLEVQHDEVPVHRRTRTGRLAPA